MDSVIAISYPDLGVARQAIVALDKLHDDKVVDVSGVVVIEVGEDGDIRSHVFDPNELPGGSGLAHMFEKIRFAIAVPRDRDVGDEMVRTIVRKAPAGSATLGLSVEVLDICRLGAGLANFGGDVLYSSLSLDDELKLVEAISKEHDGDGNTEDK